MARSRAAARCRFDGGQPFPRHQRVRARGRIGDIYILRLPSLSTGDQGADKSQMLQLLRQAYTDIRGALLVRIVQLVIHDRVPDLRRLLVETGLGLEQVRSEWAKIRLSEEPQYDYFVSYRRADAPYVEMLLAAPR